jgi:acetyl esterase/lipase
VDHEFCNQVAMLAAVSEACLWRLPPCLVLGRWKDPLKDRMRAFLEVLQMAGVAVEVWMDGIGYHAMELLKLNCAIEFIAQVSDFIRRHSAPGGDVVGANRL